MKVKRGPPTKTERTLGVNVIAENREEGGKRNIFLYFYAF